MFRVECFCDDKRLAAVMRALSGVVHDLKAVPVANLEKSAPKNGKLVPKGDGLLDLFAKYLAKIKAKVISPTEARKFMQSVGRAPESYSYLVKNAIAHGVLKRQGKGSGMRYKVV